MPTNNEEKVIIDFDIQADEAIKRITELRAGIAALRQQQKELDTSTQAGAEAFTQLGEQIKALTREMNDQSREVQNNIKQQKAATDSLNAMKAQVANLTAEYNNLSRAERESAKGTELQKHIKSLVDELSEAEQAVGNFHRQVGNYEVAGKAISDSIGEMQSAFQQFTAGGVQSATGLKNLGASFKNLGATIKTTFLANPIIAAVTAALAALVAVVKGVSDAIQGNEELSRKWSKSMATFTPIVNAVKNAFDRLATGIVNVISLITDWIAEENEAVRQLQDIEERKQALTDRERDMKKQEAEAAREAAEAKRIYADQENYTQEQRIAALDKALAKEREVSEEKVAIARENLAVMQEEASLAANNAETNDQLAEAAARVTQVEAEHNQRMTELVAQRQALLTTMKAERDAAAKAAADAAVERLTAERDAANAEEELQRELHAHTWAEQRDFDTRMHERETEYQQEVLNIKRHYGQLTQEQYSMQMAAIEQADRQWKVEMLNSEIEHAQAIRDTIASMLPSDTANQVAAVRAEYEQLFRDLEDMEAPTMAEGETEEEFKKRKDEYLSLLGYREQLERQMQTDIAEIERAGAEQRINDEMQRINDKYDAELAAAEGSVEARTQLEIERTREMLEELQRMRDDAASLEGSAREAALATINAQEIQTQQQANAAKEQADALAQERRLLAARNNSNEQYRITMESLDAQIAAEEDGSIEQERLLAQREQLERDYYSQKIDQVQEYADAAMNITSSIFEAMASAEQAELEDYKAKQDAKTAILDDRLDKNQISQKRYEEEVARLEAETAAMEEEIAAEQAQREKTQAIIDATINTALSVSKTLATLGVPAGIVPAAIAAALGAVQIATIAAAKAARGMLIQGEVKDGGMLFGASHAQGGIPIEAEGGEAIINKRSTAMFREELSAINQAGGGVRFAKGGVVSRIKKKLANLGERLMGAANVGAKETAITNSKGVRAGIRYEGGGVTAPAGGMNIINNYTTNNKRYARGGVTIEHVKERIAGLGERLMNAANVTSRHGAVARSERAFGLGTFAGGGIIPVPSFASGGSVAPVPYYLQTTEVQRITDGGYSQSVEANNSQAQNNAALVKSLTKAISQMQPQVSVSAFENVRSTQYKNINTKTTF